jgi:hypothetical protein
MRRPPHSIKTGVFSWPVIIDRLVYGIVTGGTALAAVGIWLSPFLIIIEALKTVRRCCIWKG